MSISFPSCCILSINILDLCASAMCDSTLLFFCSCKSFTYPYNFLISLVCIDISSMALVSFLTAFVGWVGGVFDVEVPVVGIDVRGCIQRNHGHLCIFFLLLDQFIHLCLHISDCVFRCMINLIISSFWFSDSPISFGCGSLIVGIFTCFLSVEISSFFFLINSSIALTFTGSYPIFMIRPSNDLILVSFSKDENISIFSWDWTFVRENRNFEAFIELLVKVEKIISPVCLCISIGSMGWMSFVSNSKEVFV